MSGEVSHNQQHGSSQSQLEALGVTSLDRSQQMLNAGHSKTRATGVGNEGSRASSW